MYNEGHIEALVEAINAMKAGNDVFMEYCTSDCERCPLNRLCDWDGHVEYMDTRLTEEVLDDFVDFYDNMQTSIEREHFYAVTGIEPGWYDFNEDRSEDR